MSREPEFEPRYLPTTRVGRVVLDFLTHQDTRHALPLTLSPSAVQLVFQVFAIAMRRAFGRNLTDDEAVHYIAAEIGRRGGARDESLRVAGLLFRKVMGLDLNPRLPRSGKDAVIPLLLDLVRTRYAPKQDLNDLVYTGERRLIYVYQYWSRTSSFWRRSFTRLRLSGIMRGNVDPGDQRRGPKSVIGRRLKALATHDLELRRRLPAEPSDAVATVVTNALFRRIIHSVFPNPPSREAVSTVADRVLAKTSGPLLPPDIVEFTIQHEFGVHEAPVGASVESVFQARVAIIASLTDDLGLYERELDSYILDAERQAGLTD